MEHLLNPLRENNIGYGYFIPRSVFDKQQDIAEIYATRNTPFLNMFKEELSNYADKTYKDFSQTNALDSLYCLLNIYNIDFKSVYNNTTDLDKPHVITLIDFALDFSNNRLAEIWDSFNTTVYNTSLRK